MKNSLKQKDDQTEGKRGWKHKVNPCNDLDESPWRDKEERVGTPEKKDEQKESRI